MSSGDDHKSVSEDASTVTDTNSTQKSHDTSPNVQDQAPLDASIISLERTPPPLPPRRSHSPVGSLRILKSGEKISGSPRPALHTRPTTALSIGDVQSRAVSGALLPNSPSVRQFSFAGFNFGSTSNGKGKGSDAEDSGSVRSYAPSVGPGGGADLESMLGDAAHLGRQSSGPDTGRSGEHQSRRRSVFAQDPEVEEAFEQEFHELDDITSDGLNEEAVQQQWKSKIKHFLILSSAGKPIWSRHGNDQLITSYVGMLQTLISFYQDADDELRGFTAGNSRFVVLTKGPLHLLAITKLNESDQQLKSQLDALYMQILSTLTLPVMERMFKARASTDLRRPLQGTEKLLSALADGFTRGSPSTLLGALECLRIRKSHRAVINNALLKVKTDNLLYGLIVAGGRLVSVIRPRKQSLHPGDLHLIFNMLFEASGVRANAEEENWIPLCLPGFNNTGYVYMYASYFDLPTEPDLDSKPPVTASLDKDIHKSQIAILLISPSKEAFYSLQKMKQDLIVQLKKTGATTLLSAAIRRSRPPTEQILGSSTPLIHFLYKSRGNVQYFMPSYPPAFTTPFARRQVLSMYGSLQAAIHSRSTHPKILYGAGTHLSSIAWATPVFELYAVAERDVERKVLAEAANRVVQYVRKEEERVFIIGGAVY